MSDLPPCGLYRTRTALGELVPAGSLVYFHNHGNPGAGIYLPRGWMQNRAQWHEQGVPLPNDAWASELEPVTPEGSYRVTATFTCCDKKCRTFEPEQLVQLGYNGNAEPILFLPEWREEGFTLPERGFPLDPKQLTSLAAVRVEGAPSPMLH